MENDLKKINVEIKQFPEIGDRIEGIILTHKDATEKKPLIVCPHGGPHSAFVLSFGFY